MQVVKIKYLKGVKAGNIEDKFLEPANILVDAGVAEFVKELKAEAETKELKLEVKTKGRGRKSKD